MCSFSKSLSMFPLRVRRSQKRLYENLPVQTKMAILSRGLIILAIFLYKQFKHHTGPAGSVVEHPLRDREVVGSNPGRAIPKALKWYQWLPCLVLSIIRQAWLLFS